MKRIISFISALIVSMTSVLGVLAPITVRAAAETDNKPAPAPTTRSTAGDSRTYKYVAQSGDSYSVMARKAVQTYGLKNKVKLSRAKIIAAETRLTQAAGSPYLNLGQAVEIKESSLKDQVDRAQKMSATEEAAWNVYTAGVNFNTDAVGQSR